MKRLFVVLLAACALTLTAFTPASRLVSRNGHVNFYSHTSLEDITANNYKILSTLDTQTGDVVFSVPMQSFEFEKSLMQEHFNGKDFLNTKSFPKAKFIGKIINLNDVSLDKDGSYKAEVAGELTIKDQTRTVTTTATVKVEGTRVSVESKFSVILADYGISFTKGKPSTNIAKSIDITFKGDYQPE